MYLSDHQSLQMLSQSEVVLLFSPFHLYDATAARWHSYWPTQLAHKLELYC